MAQPKSSRVLERPHEDKRSSSNVPQPPITAPLRPIALLLLPQHPFPHACPTVLPWDAPEGDGVGAGFAPLAHQEGSVPWHPHQHVLSLGTSEVGVVPPFGRHTDGYDSPHSHCSSHPTQWGTNGDHHPPEGTAESWEGFLWCTTATTQLITATLTLCSHGRWSEAPALSASSQTHCTSAAPPGSG